MITTPTLSEKAGQAPFLGSLEQPRDFAGRRLELGYDCG
jgi:hypothetical protein